MELRKSQYIYRKVIIGDNLTPVMGTEANARDRSKDCLLQVVISHTKSAKSSLLHGKTWVVPSPSIMAKPAFHSADRRSTS